MGDARRAMIVGAGPVGLAAALLLARKGIATRVIEKREHASRESRALAVNPRTLALLEASGVAASMLEMGRVIRGARLHRGGRIVGSVGFEGVHEKYPFMLALSQAATERLLEAALAKAGVSVERGVELIECRAIGGGVEVELASGPEPGGGCETARAPWLLGADGARSTVRARMGIGFPGRGFRHEWFLADTPMRTGLEEDHAHVMLKGGGVFVFLIRVVNPALEGERGSPVWRVISNRRDPISLVDGAEAAGAPLWESEFHIAHRLSAAFARDGVYLAGDAAHIHSPIGARGMNLGIEDAWVLAELAGAGRLDRYAPMRRPVDRAVVRRVALMSRLVAGEPAVLGAVRDLLMPLALRLPTVQRRMRPVVSGLDHDLGGLPVASLPVDPC